MNGEDTGSNEGKMPDVDPTEFVKAMLGISAEDAEKVRDSTPGARRVREARDASGRAKELVEDSAVRRHSAEVHQHDTDEHLARGVDRDGLDD